MERWQDNSMTSINSATKRKVLVIEDDSFVRQFVCYVFKSLNFETFEAEDGIIGMSLFKASLPDAVVTDINMPGPSGLQTIQEIRAHHSQMKIIAISGGGYTDRLDNLEEAKRLGADWVLKKPFLPADLEKIVSGF